MRKVTVVLDPGLIKRMAPKKFHAVLDKIESMEGRHLVKLDPYKGVKIAIADVKMKEGYTIGDLELGGSIMILDVFHRADRTFTCLIKTTGDMRLGKLAGLLDLDIMFEPPFHYDGQNLVVSFVADNRTVRLVLAALRILGRIIDLQVRNATFVDADPTAVLTEKQKRAIIAAKRLGYYDIPRKARTQDVAKRLNLSKATVLEHLRKAEKRLITQMLSGR